MVLKYNCFVRCKTCIGSSCGGNGVVLENCTPDTSSKDAPIPPDLPVRHCDYGFTADVFQSRHPDTAARCFYTCSHFNVSNYFHYLFFFICVSRLLIFYWNLVV